MNPRERIQAALNRQAPDRCPMQISFTPEFADRLRADMAMREKTLNLSRSGHNPHGGGNTYDLERALGVDLLQTSVGWANSYYQAGDTYTDEWGITWVSHPYETPFGTGHYTETTGRPLSDASALDSYQPPDPHRPELVRGRGPAAGQLRGRVLDRRRDRLYHLRDGLGAARLRTDDD